MNKNTILSIDKKHIYHIGIIDYLQDYNLTKIVERLIKQPMAEDKYFSVAAAPPSLYQARFMSFIKEQVFPIEGLVGITQEMKLDFVREESKSFKIAKLKPRSKNSGGFKYESNDNL